MRRSLWHWSNEKSLLGIKMKTGILFCLAVSSLLACRIESEQVEVKNNNTVNDPNVDDSGTDSPSDLPDVATVPPTPATHSDGIKNLGESDIDCGGESAENRCPIGKACTHHWDCASNACSYQHKCIDESKSCSVHFGGDTCGLGEVAVGQHESCCRSLKVPGFKDPKHPGKTVYLDKYEITAGRVRAFIADITSQMGGKPNVKGWIFSNPQTVWNDNWTIYLPSDTEGDLITINRLLLGDPRHDGETPEQAGPGVIIPPAADMAVSLGLNSQFGGQIYADLHGNNCGTYAGSYGFPTYYYPDAVQIKNGEVPRAVGQDILDVKSMNCITNAMLAAFCAWDGGQLATADVMDYVAGNVNPSNSVSGCGTQYDSHGELLGNIFTNTVQYGGRCAPVNEIIATFDAGENLPVPGSYLNAHVYWFPTSLMASTSDKAWQIAAPGRIPVDTVRINAGDEPWMDLAGNLSEAVITNSGLFGIRFRGVGYGSSRSDLNVTYMPGENVLRVQRPEAKTALVGGRCMRFK